MRVCVVSHGNMLHVVGRLRFFVELGWDVHWAQIAAGQYEIPGATVHPLYISSRQKLSPLAKISYVLAGMKLRRLLGCLNPDLVWPHYVSSAGMVVWMSGWPSYCVTIHGSDLLERSRTRLGRAALKQILSRASLVNPVADHMVPRLRELGVPGDRILALSHGIDLERFPYQPARIEDCDEMRLVCTRTFNSPLYDIPTVVRAVATLRDRGVGCRLLLAATGPLEAEIRAEVGQLGLANRVTFGGGYRREELPPILASGDFYVSTSRWDGTSVSLLEAMACGIYPVVSDIPANRGLIRHGENGHLFPVGDHAALADCIVEASSLGSGLAIALRQNRELVEEVGDQKRNLDRLARRARETVA